MWPFMVVLYVFGIIGTAFFVLKGDGMKENRVMNSGVILLWPVYWGYFFVFMFLNRRGGR